MEEIGGKDLCKLIARIGRGGVRGEGSYRLVGGWKGGMQKNLYKAFRKQFPQSSI